VAALRADGIGGSGARVALVHERRVRARVECERRLRRLRAAAAAAAWTSEGAAARECWWRGTAMAAWRIERRLRESEIKWAKTEKEERTAARARHIYDMWAPQFSLTPVKPMLRFRMPVDYIGSVYPKLQQKFI
jgi:hypothetical protein